MRDHADIGDEAARASDPGWLIGLVGFSYPEWSKTLYAGHQRPALSKGSHRLRAYSRRFSAVEINTTFYGIPTLDSVRVWAEATPPDFRFCVKAPRDVTHGPTPAGALASAEPPPGHLLREGTLDNARRFLDALRPLGGKLGAALLQFPPKFAAHRRDELATFLDTLGRATPLAVELRHDSWWNPDTAAILRDRGVCWAATDESPRDEAERAPIATDKRAPRPIQTTADFLYIRWLGKHGQFDDRSREHFDPSKRLHWWIERLRAALSHNPRIRAVYAFFDNDLAGYAPATARRFMGLLEPSVPKSDAQEPNEPTLFG